MSNSSPADGHKPLPNTSWINQYPEYRYEIPLRQHGKSTEAKIKENEREKIMEKTPQPLLLICSKLKKKKKKLFKKVERPCLRTPQYLIWNDLFLFSFCSLGIYNCHKTSSLFGVLKIHHMWGVRKLIISSNSKNKQYINVKIFIIRI